MPITKELKNIKTFESAGFTHEQAESLTDVIEESHADSQESLKEFIRDELGKQTKDVDIKFSNLDVKFSNLDVKLNALETRLMISQKDILVKIFAIIVGTVGVAVTIIKVF
ncbi:MAG: hypothetical protein ACUZ8O_06385 [Candidatus Anammoxibacter sp.]